MTDTLTFNTGKKRLAGCLIAALSTTSSVVISKSITHNNLSQLQSSLPIALAVGLCLGILYYYAMAQILPRLHRDHHGELWAGLSWFNLATISLWGILLPLPTYYIDFGIGFIFTGGCARLIGSVYTIFGTSLSNRKRFANTFVMLALTIMLVISVVKASLALSLGLVGALSIVRFRTAIKEPEELAFLFFTVAIGLGFGAEKFGVTLAAFWAICVGFIFFCKIRTSNTMDNAYMVTIYGPKEGLLNSVHTFLDEHNLTYEFTRLETSDTSNHVSFLVEMKNSNVLNILGQKFQDDNPQTNVSIIQARSLF
ncbi:DUF4956 domain-containing protein [Pseudodesulfovibrio piezophilus]|uniref:DUF4956 domain-containing protein n=1 Tax=Pseudodesulfovibrio piezophilus (strain DSM 21447 / JCM 15486 / C1TLV30) TaxID=1322246 RepID=M1WLU0_PSEP2|nr:DUF4956 domain-containing protein [Pseudodesulfovibrio piezophilus]CCH48445.1 membrane protein of unknown function [Pseudodesulfovibrio piezophilus C1TLV30]